MANTNLGSHLVKQSRRLGGKSGFHPRDCSTPNPTKTKLIFNTCKVSKNTTCIDELQFWYARSSYRANRTVYS